MLFLVLGLKETTLAVPNKSLIVVTMVTTINILTMGNHNKGMLRLFSLFLYIAFSLSSIMLPKVNINLLIMNLDLDRNCR